MNRVNLFAALAATALFAGIGLTAYAIDHPKRSTGGFLAAPEQTDIVLNNRVEALLRTDIGLAGSRFRIQTHAAIVTLGGGVPDEHARHRALELAASVKGVREVRNQLEIELPK